MQLIRLARHAELGVGAVIGETWPLLLNRYVRHAELGVGAVTGLAWGDTQPTGVVRVEC